MRFGPLFLIWVSYCLSATAKYTLSELLSNVPQCSWPCLSDGTSDCDSQDLTCVCSDKSISKAIELCISDRCTIKESFITQNATSAACGIPVRDKSQLLINVTIILGTFSGFFVLLRLGSKLFITNSSFGLDDTFIMLTLLCAIPSTAMNIHGAARHGEGKDIWTLDSHDVTQFGIYFYILHILYFAQVSLLKMSLLFFYLRIFQGLTRNLLWATVAFNAMFGIVFVFLGVFECWPISYFWTGWDGEHHGSCLNTNAIAWANAGISVALDVWMLAIPLHRLWSLKMHWKKKTGVAAMFIVGTFITIVSVIRLQSLVHLGGSQNFTYDHTNVSIWSTVEIHVGIICASMPAVRILLVRLFPILGGSSYDSSNYQSHGEIYGRMSRIITRNARVELSSRGEPTTTPEHGGIELMRTFDVQYSDGDEKRLVGLGGFEAKAHGGSTNSAHSASEVSL
ncbi:hypothetical protein EDB81DRAFT_952355 [Dactylonectria macrodidyma]|uniref:Extracellular membrane protein CFEM domain-containing protein n=1 Tax=Dactylonectria macrodidyma TaxID=307937 RepID=A0A9P9DM26_9HYPO|nr:hypothetical protein EDB81DRAFT_952355 [Dactylonectria macrodidyma]